MNRRKIFAAVIAVFLALTALPYLVWPAVRPHVDTGNYEKRALAVMPVWGEGTLTEYVGGILDYLEDHRPFHNQLVRVNHAIDYFVFHRDPNGEVLCGKDGWLFYASERDGDPVACYKGRNLFTGEELSRIAENLTASRDRLREEGAEFVLLILPDKERIYPEYMPDYLGDPAPEYGTLQLVRYLRENTDIRVVYPYEELMAAKENTDALVYLKTDTHWTDVGGYTGAYALCRELSVPMPAPGSPELTVIRKKPETGDLVTMLNLGPFIPAESSWRFTGYDDHGMQEEKWDFFTEFIYHCEGADPRKLFVVRDSFGTALSDALGARFDDSFMVHYQHYDPSMVNAEKPDIFVFECVERLVPNLLNFRYEGGE